MNMPVQDNVLQNNEPSITHSHDAGAAFESILESSMGRMPHLPPLRYGRMMQSPLTTASMPTLSGVASHFPETAARFFERLMGDVPPEFAIRDLQQPPVAYQKSRRAELGSRSFGEALKITMKLRPAVT